MNKKFFMAGFIAVAAMAMTSCGGNAPAKATNDSAATATNDTTKEVAIDLKDYGCEPTVLDIDEYTLGNDNFRTALWTGTNLQVTLMSIPVGGDIGLEQHLHIDQFLRIEDGEGRAMMGDTKEEFGFTRNVKADDAIFVPAGKWHNIVNTGDKPLKLYSIYAPVEHPHGTIHKTQADAEAAEHH